MSSMDPNFHCFIEIDGHKYDLIIGEDISSVCFEDIYNKVQQIIRLALNYEISFETHLFEVIDSKTNKGLFIQTFGEFVKHLSTIRIHPIPAIYGNPSITPCDQSKGPQTYTQDLTPNQVINGVNHKSNEFVPHEYYCDVCPQSADKIDPRLKKHKYNLNFESYKRYSDLLTTIKEMSDSNCDTISDYQWVNIIPYKMRAFCYKDFPNKLWKHAFEIFLQKYIEVMEVSPNQFMACSLFPFFHEFNGFHFNVNDSVNYKKITDLRQKMNRTESLSPKKKPKKTIKERKSFNEFVGQLVTGKEDIKAFHLMVQLIDPKQVYKKKAKKKWQRLSEHLSRYGYSSRIYSARNCREKFNLWAEFYAKNYSKQKGISEPEIQEIFDLLKIVHILDFTKMWSEKNVIHIHLRKLSHLDEVKQYLDELEDKKLELKSVDKQKKNVLKTNTFSESDKDLTAIDMDVEEGESHEVIIEEMNDIKPIINLSVGSMAESSIPGRKSKPVVPRTDPRLNRLNCVKPVPSSLTVDHKRLDVNPINVNTIASKIMTTDLSQKGTVPRLDPRLMRKNVGTTHSNPQSIVIPVPTQESPQTIRNAVIHSNTNHVIEAVLPLKTSVPSIFDPRIRHKSCATTNNNRVEERPQTLSGQQSSDKTKLISIQTTTSSTQLSSLRDPRLKRKLEQQSDVSIKQSSVESSVQNPNKKFKLESIKFK